ncbi:MAG: SBBP repeat-containing protein [Promethearchaeota archaeon]
MKKKLLIFLILTLNLSISLIMTRNYCFDCKPNYIRSKIDEFTLNLSAEQDLFEEWYRTWDSGYTDYVYAITLDSLENIYIAGKTSTETGQHLVIIKFDKNGNYQWNRTTIFAAEARAMEVDSSDNIYIAATFAYTPGIVYLIKYDPSGDLQWNKTWDPPSSEQPFDIAIDAFNNIYITGYSQSNPGKLQDVFLVKYNSTGDQQWVRTWGGNAAEVSYGVATDSSDGIYLTGLTESYGTGDMDIFVMKYNSSGMLQWNYTVGTDTPYNERGFDIALDSLENIYVKGNMYGGDILFKFDHFGIYQWNKTYATYTTYYPWSDLEIDSLGNFFMTGDRWLMKCNSSGDLLWTTNILHVNHLTDTALDSDNNVYISGYGNNDALLIKYSSKPKIIIESPQIGDFFGKNAPNFNLTIYEPNVDTSWYSVDGGITNDTFEGSIGQIDQMEWDKLGHGTHNITFYVNDSYGNEGFSEIEINKDIKPPKILIYEPTPDSIYGDIPPNYSISALDQFKYNDTNYNHLDLVWYTIDGGLTNITITHPDFWVGTIDADAWSDAPYGNITIRFYATDDFGNIGFTDVIVEKRSEIIPKKAKTPAIIGYNLILITGIVSVISVIIIRNRKSK